MYETQRPQPQYRINKFVLVESEGYRDPWIRPYEVNATYEDYNKVQHIVEQAMHKNAISGVHDMVANLNPNILMPSAQVLTKAEIINGWSEKRLKFVLILEVIIPGSVFSVLNYVQGYTDYLGVTPSGAIDPNMRFYINSITVLNKMFDTNTKTISVIPQFSYNIATNEIEQLPGYNPHQLRLARPDDLLVEISTLKTTDASVQFDNRVGNLNDINVVEKRTLVPVNHIGKTLESAINSRLVASAYSDSEDVIGAMIGDMMGPSVEQIEFFRLLMNMGGVARQRNSFTIGDIDTITNDYKVDIILGNNGMLPKASVDLPPMLLTEDTAEMYDPSLETRMAVVIHESVSTLLTESLLSGVAFSINNYAGMPQYTPHEITSYIEGLDTVFQFEQFMAKFIKRVWPTISNNNSSIVDISIRALNESDTTIAIRIDGRPEIIYRLPTFADSKFLPIIVDEARMQILAENYGEIVDTAIESATNVLKQKMSQGFAQQVNPTIIH